MKRAWFFALGASLLLLHCGGEIGSEQRIEPFPRPDLSLLDTAADFPEAQRDQLEASAKTGSAGERAEAYGKLGMLYHAYNMYQPAQVCYGNARTLVPEDSRWLHLMGHIYRLMGDNEKARGAFVDAIRLDPQNASAMVVLGEIELIQNKLERAEELFGNAVRLEGDLTAAYIGLGKVAAARGNFQKAIDMYGKALAREPEATVVHYPMAMAWRSLNDQEKARYHLELRGETPPILADPLLLEVEMLRNDAEAMRQRGNQAAAEGRYQEALQFYTDALKGNPKDPRVWINVGLCYQETDNSDQAIYAYQKVIEFGKLPALVGNAHLRLGDLLERKGESGEEHYKQAVTLMPEDLTAIFRHAETERAAGRFEAALPWYEKAVNGRPDHEAARLGRVLSLIALQRWQDAAIALQEDIQAAPAQPAFPHFLARLLAAAPDEKVRNAQQALLLTEKLSAVMQGSDIMATRAMALAEAGRFQDAVSRQQSAVSFAVEEGRGVAFHQALLLQYRKNKPCRAPWPKDDPLFSRKSY